MQLFIYTLACCSMLFYFLHKKTHMSLQLMYKDNLIISCICFFIVYSIARQTITSFVITFVVLPVMVFLDIQFRFWRSPKRNMIASSNQIVSPADGKIIYLNNIKENDSFMSIKNGKVSELNEIIKTNLIKKPCWQIGINMTPFDVHKNCSPIDGIILLSEHISGRFHSLKSYLSMIENERHTYIIENDKCRIGVIQIASKRVKRIDTYVKTGQKIQKGDWIGMIRFGSQVDLFLPEDVKICIKLKDQVYAKQSIIAEMYESLN